MGDPSLGKHPRSSRRTLAAGLSLSFLLPPSEALAALAPRAPARLPASATSLEGLKSALQHSGFAPSPAAFLPPAAPSASPVRAAAAHEPERWSALLRAGVRAGELRRAAEGSPAAEWVESVLRPALAELADEAELPAALLERLRSSLPALTRALAPAPAALEPSHAGVHERLSRLGLPALEPPSALPSIPPALPRPAAPETESLPERLGQRRELAQRPADAEALARLEELLRRSEASLGEEPGPGPGFDRDQEQRWAALDGLLRLFDAGAGPERSAGPVDPPPPELAREIEQRVARIEALKAELQAGLAARDAAESMLQVAERARQSALMERRGGRQTLEFRRNFARLSMVMDLSYSLSILNSADQALGRMQALLDDKVRRIDERRRSNRAGADEAARQAGNVEQWRRDAQQAAAEDRSQAASFDALSRDVGGIVDALRRFRADVPALLAAIDGRDRFRSPDALTEYERRLAALPALRASLISGSGSGLASMSLQSLQAQSRELESRLRLLSGADDRLARAPLEFAGVLIALVPGVPEESLSNPDLAQTQSLLARRREFWRKQLDEQRSMLASVERSLNAGDASMIAGDFGEPRPESLSAWKRRQEELDGELERAAAPLLAQADAAIGIVERAAGASLPRLSGATPEQLRDRLPELLDRLEAARVPEGDAGWEAKAALIDLGRLVSYLGDATARRLEARATASILEKPIRELLPKARSALARAVTAWEAALEDVSADEAFLRAGLPAAGRQALIDRKRALLRDSLSPALLALQELVDRTLIPYQNERIAQSEPGYQGDGYATLYREKAKLYRRIAEGLREKLPWALASNGARPYDAGAARAGIAELRRTIDRNRATVADYVEQVRRRKDPGDGGTEQLYGKTMPYSLVKRARVHREERARRVVSLNARAREINDILGRMDALEPARGLLAAWRLPTDLQDSPAGMESIDRLVSARRLQDMGQAIKAAAQEAERAAGSAQIGLGTQNGIPVGTQPPLDVSPKQRYALLGLEAVKRLVPATATGEAGDSYAQSVAEALFADAVATASQKYLDERIPLFEPYLARARAALDAASADLDLDLGWVAGERAGGEAVLARKETMLLGLAQAAAEGARLFEQKAGWSLEGVDSVARVRSYYDGVGETYGSADEALDAELRAARQFQDALAKSRSDILAQRDSVVGWLRQLNDPNESAMSRVAQNLSAIQDATRAVLESNVSARRAERERDKAKDGVERAARALAAERAALDQALSGVGELARLGGALAARTRDALGAGGAWIADGPRGPQTLVIPKSQLGRFLEQLLGSLAPDSAARELVALRESILRDPAALSRLLPGSRLMEMGSGSDGFYLVYQSEFSTPGGLETAQQATLGNVASLFGQNVSLIGHRFASPPSPGNAPFGDQGLTVRVESLDSDHVVNYLDVTFHKFIQDIPGSLTVDGQARQTRMMIFDDFALLLNDGKGYFGAAGFADFAADGAAGKPQYYGGNMKARVKFTEVLSLNAEETVLFAKDPRRFLQTVNLDFTRYDPTLDQTFLIEGQGQDRRYRRDRVGLGVDVARALGQSDSFVVDFYYARTQGTDEANQGALGATLLKGFTFDLGGQRARLQTSGGAELGERRSAFHGRVAFELPDQGMVISAEGKLIGTGSSYLAEIRRRTGENSSIAASYGSRYIGLNDRFTVSFESSYTLGELWRAVTGQAAADLAGGRALADFDRALADFFSRGASEHAVAELRRVFETDVARRLIALELGRVSREIAELRRAGALIDNVRQTAMLGFVSNAIGPGTAERATGGGFQVGTRTDLTLTRSQRELAEKKSAALLSLGLDLEERLLELARDWQRTLSELAAARWRELLAGWLAAHADDPVLRAEAETDAARAADRRRQAQLRYAALTGRGPHEAPPFDGVNPRDLERLLELSARALAQNGRLGELISRVRGGMELPPESFNALDWIPWIERLTFSVGAQLPELLSSQALGASVSVSLPIYDPARPRERAALRLENRAILLEMSERLRRARLRARDEAIAARAWTARAEHAGAHERRTAAELSDGIRAYRNGLLQASELRVRARRWRDVVSEALEARARANLEQAWMRLDLGGQDVLDYSMNDTPAPRDFESALSGAALASGSWEALGRRSEAARELLAASESRVRSVSLELSAGLNLTALGVAFIPAFGITGLGAWPSLGVTLAPEELRRLDQARRGEEAALYARLRDKAAADAALALTQAALDVRSLSRQAALYRDELLPALEAAQDGSSARALELSRARAALDELGWRRRQAQSAVNHLLGRRLDAPEELVEDPERALAALERRARELDPVAAARDALVSRIAVARAVESAVDRNLRVERIRVEPISLIGRSLGRLVAALSGEGAGSPELMELARERTVEAERALEAFDANLPALRARLETELSSARAARAALAGRAEPAARLQDLELSRREHALRAQLALWGGSAERAESGALPSSFAELEDRLRRAALEARLAIRPREELGALAGPNALEASSVLRYWDARQTLGGEPVGRRFVEGWIEARLRSPATPMGAREALARLREEAADERRRLDASAAGTRAELLLARLRLGASLLRWSEGMGLGGSVRARLSADLAEAAALLRLPPGLRPERLLELLPADPDGGLAGIASRYLEEAESLDLAALERTLFVHGLPEELRAGRDLLPQLQLDLIAERMSSRGFTPLAAVGMFRGSWVQAGMLEAPQPEQIRRALVEVLDDALRRELESKDRLQQLGLLLHSLMASVAEKSRTAAAARARELLARRALAGALERARLRLLPVSEAAAAAVEAQAAQDEFIAALYALREDFLRLTAELTALGLKPGAAPGRVRRAPGGDEPAERSPRERLLAYWADRMLDPAFAARVDALLAAAPEGERAALRELAERYRAASRDADAVRTNDFSPAERLELLIKVDLQGRRRLLERALARALKPLEEGGAASPAWTELMGFLRADLEARAGEDRERLAARAVLRREMSAAFRAGLALSPERAALVDRLETLRARADETRLEALSAWLGRSGGAREHLVKDRALEEHVAALDAYDRELEKALGDGSDAGWTRRLDSLFDVRESLRRRRERLRHGRGALTLDAAIALDESRLRAAGWENRENRELGPASESLAFLRRLRERWTGRPQSMPALVALRGAAGTEWATVEELARARAAGRVVVIDGRPFLAPAAAGELRPTDAVSARARGWREIVEGEDAARERLRDARERRERAAHEASLARALESAELIALEPGGAARRELSLAELRALEAAGRALWFEAVPDASGARRAVPAAGARWRDPAELTLILQEGGETAPPGRFPTLESLRRSAQAGLYREARIGRAGLEALDREAAAASLRARREGWLRLKLQAWGFALDAEDRPAAVYLSEEELSRAAEAAKDPKDPGHGWRYLRADALALGLGEDGTVLAARVDGRLIRLGDGPVVRWLDGTPLALETDARGRVRREFSDRAALEAAAAGWSFEDVQGRRWAAEGELPPLLRARRWLDPRTGLTISLGRELLERRRAAAADGESRARNWGYRPAQWPELVLEIPRGVVQAPLEIFTGRDPNQHGYLGRANARRLEGGSTRDHGPLGNALRALDLLQLFPDPVERVLDPSQYPARVRRDRPRAPGDAAGDADMRTPDGRRRVFFGVGSFARERRWAEEDLELSRVEVLAAFRGGVRRVSVERRRGRAGPYEESSALFELGRGAALAALEELGARLDPEGGARTGAAPRRHLVDQVDSEIQVVAGAEIHDARRRLYAAAARRLLSAVPAEVSEEEIAEASAALEAALAARRAAEEALKSAPPRPALPGVAAAAKLFAKAGG